MRSAPKKLAKPAKPQPKAKQIKKPSAKATPAKAVTPAKKTPAKPAANRFKITMITGNKKKLEEFMTIMSDDLRENFNITNQSLDLEEIQGEPKEIALKKVKTAA